MFFYCLSSPFKHTYSLSFYCFLLTLITCHVIYITLSSHPSLHLCNYLLPFWSTFIWSFYSTYLSRFLVTFFIFSPSTFSRFPHNYFPFSLQYTLPFLLAIQLLALFSMLFFLSSLYAIKIYFSVAPCVSLSNYLSLSLHWFFLHFCFITSTSSVLSPHFPYILLFLRGIDFFSFLFKYLPRSLYCSLFLFLYSIIFSFSVLFSPPSLLNYLLLFLCYFPHISLFYLFLLFHTITFYSLYAIFFSLTLNYPSLSRYCSLFSLFPYLLFPSYNYYLLLCFTFRLLPLHRITFYIFYTDFLAFVFNYLLLSPRYSLCVCFSL